MAGTDPGGPPAPEPVIRDATAADRAAILALNLAFEHLLSPMDGPRLRALEAMALRHRVADVGGDVGAFLLVFGPGAAYDSVNYRWFDTRYRDFVYVDRIVVGDAHQGRGLARRLYDDLFDFACAGGFQSVVAEFDVEPPNEASRRFHAALGFEAVGEQRVGASGKRVSLQRAAVPGR